MNQSYESTKELKSIKSWMNLQWDQYLNQSFGTIFYISSVGSILKSILWIININLVYEQARMNFNLFLQWILLAAAAPSKYPVPEANYNDDDDYVVIVYNKRSPIPNPTCSGWKQPGSLSKWKHLQPCLLLVMCTCSRGSSYCSSNNPNYHQ